MSVAAGPPRVVTTVVMTMRRILWVTLPLVFLVTFAASMSDRVPALLRRSAFRLGVGPRLADGVAGVDPFLLLHAAGWAFLAFGTAMAIGRVVWVPFVAASLLAVGVAIEVAQELATTVRAYEILDVVANAVGVTLGCGLALVVLLGVSSRTSV